MEVYKATQPLFDETTGKYFYPQTVASQVGMEDGTTLDAFLKSMGSGMELLWTNASPSSEFSEQTISLALSSYKYVAIENTEMAGSTNDGGGFDIIPVGKDGSCIGIRKNSGAIYFRYAKVQTTGITFGKGSYIAGNTGNDNNAWCVPLYIYGIK